MLRTRFLILVGLAGCGLDTAGDGGGSSSSDTGDTSATSTPTTTLTTAPTTEPTTDPTTDPTTGTTGTESTAADTTTEGSSSSDSESSSTEVTGSGWGPFGDVTPLEGVNDEIADDDDPTLSSDMLEIYFNSTRFNTQDILVARRASVDDPFDLPVVVPELTTPFAESVPELAPDDLTMTFSSNRPGGAGGFDVLISTRENLESPWSVPVHIAELNTTAGDGALALTGDGLTAVMCRALGVEMDYQLFRTTRPSTDDLWEEPTLIDALLTEGRDCSPWITADGAELWWSSNQPDPLEDENLYRVALDGGELDGRVEEVTELNTDFLDDDPWLSPDGAVIVFASDRDGSVDIYTARREPV